jgi:hypothetical protein
MGESMQIPAEWLAEAGMQSFTPGRSSFLCDQPHVLIPLADIEQPVRIVPLDANGFARDRLLRILVGIRDDHFIPPIDVEIADPGQRPYRLRGGVHRYCASLGLGFSHVPADIVERLD